MILEEQHKFIGLDERHSSVIKVMLETRADFEHFKTIRHEIDRFNTKCEDAKEDSLSALHRNLNKVPKTGWFPLWPTHSKAEIEQLDVIRDEWYRAYHKIDRQIPPPAILKELAVGKYMLKNWYMAPSRWEGNNPTATDEYVLLYSNVYYRRFGSDRSPDPNAEPSSIDLIG